MTTPDKIMGWVQFYGSASATAALALCTKGDARTAQRLAEDAVIALDQIRAAIEQLRQNSEPGETKPDFVMPGQIWRHNANPTYRVKIEEVRGPRAIAQPVDKDGDPNGDKTHLAMDGLRAILGYTRDRAAEQRAAERAA